MNSEVTSSFTFRTYHITNIEFNINHNFITTGKIDINFNVNHEIKKNVEDETWSVKLHTLIFDKAEENNYPFTIKLSIEGIFSIESEEPLPDEEILKFCSINGTAALFPFLRSAVTDITKISNVPPLVLPLVNIYNLINQQ